MKESKKVIQNLVFDDYEYAVSVKNEAEGKIKKIKIGLIIAAIASIVSIFLVSTQSDKIRGICLVIVLPCAIASYIIGGGFLTALKAVKKLAFIGWFICPFPVDIATGICTMIFAGVAFFLFPVVFVFINYRQQNKNLKEATKYLSHYKPANEVQYTKSAEGSEV